MEAAIQENINGLRMDIYTQLDLCLNHHGELISGVQTQSLQSWNDLRQKVPRSLTQLQQSAYKYQLPAFHSKCQLLLDRANTMRIEMDGAFQMPYIDENKYNTVLAQYGEIDQILQELLQICSNDLSQLLIQGAGGLGQGLARAMSVGKNADLVQSPVPTSQPQHHPPQHQPPQNQHQNNNFPPQEQSNFEFDQQVSFDDQNVFAEPPPAPDQYEQPDQGQGYHPQVHNYQAPQHAPPPHQPPQHQPNLPQHGGPQMPPPGAPSYPPQGYPPQQRPYSPNLGSSPMAPGDPRGSQALNDLISSEREYVKNLSLVLTRYFAPLKAWTPKNKKILTEAEVDQMFQGLDMISKFHTQFLQRLEGTKDPAGEPLGLVIKTMAPMMRVYTNYINNQDATMELLKKAKKASKPFTALLEDCKQKSGSPNDLEFFLQLPPKRLPQYEILITNLVNQTPQDHADYGNLSEASQEIKKVSEHIEKSKTQMDGKAKIIEIQQKLGPNALPNGMNLVAPHRVFVREGQMSVKTALASKTKSGTCYVFAFNDILLVAKQTGTFSKEMKVAEIVFYSDARLEDPKDEDKPAFRLVISKKSLSLTFYPGDDKMQWLNDLKYSIDTFKKNRATGTVVDQSIGEERVENLQTKLLVRLIAGSDLIPCSYDPPDIFVQFELESVIKKSTVKERCRFDPEWDEKYLMIVRNPYEQFLTVTVRDKASPDVTYGSVTLPLAELNDFVEWLNWHSLKYADGTPARGKLLLGVTIGPNFQHSSFT